MQYDTVTIQTAQGPIDFSYVISTPTNPRAKAVVPGIPTVVFLHPEYTWHVGFHPQFADANMRKFNLVGIDNRGLGHTVGPLSPDFGPIQASEDIASVLDALHISKAHFFGLSTGTLTAVHFAMKYPLRCLSCFLVSPLAMQEPSDVFEGRTQVADCLLEGFEKYEFRNELLRDSCWGALQLAVTNKPNRIMNATSKYALESMSQKWDSGRHLEIREATLDFVVARRHYSREDFTNIQCPVKLVYCSEGLAYSRAHAEGIRYAMQDAGVLVTLEEVATCHYGSMTAPNEINAMFLRFLAQVDPSSSSLFIPKQVTSPFEEFLREWGWTPDPDHDSDSDTSDVEL